MGTPQIAGDQSPGGLVINSAFCWENNECLENILVFKDIRTFQIASTFILPSFYFSKVWSCCKYFLKKCFCTHMSRFIHISHTRSLVSVVSLFRYIINFRRLSDFFLIWGVYHRVKMLLNAQFGTCKIINIYFKVL